MKLHDSAADTSTLFPLQRRGPSSSEIYVDHQPFVLKPVSCQMRQLSEEQMHHVVMMLVTVRAVTDGYHGQEQPLSLAFLLAFKVGLCWKTKARGESIGLQAQYCP
jgi:hypothetical protein